MLLGRQDSNLRPLDPQPSALPDCATSQNTNNLRECKNKLLHAIAPNTFSRPTARLFLPRSPPFLSLLFLIMTDAEKQAQLRRHKALATGLFLLMVAGYAACTWAMRRYTAPWLGYVHAFTEAAMVGALADWFAVTALFSYPLGLRIPHTNLIERGKQRIGSNLGDFVVENFLTPANLRPYLARLSAAGWAADWLAKEKSKALLLDEAGRMAQGLLRKIDDRQAARFIARKGSELLQEIKLPPILSGGIHYLLDAGEHEAAITALAGKLKGFISQNQTLVRDRVKSESFFLIPNFVNNKVADKITAGLATYFEELEQDPQHRLRAEITAQLRQFAESLATDPQWEERLSRMQSGILAPARLQEHAGAAWASLRRTLEAELANPRSALWRYVRRSLDGFAQDLRTDETMRQKIDGWLRVNAYRLVLRNRQQVGALISNTVGNWQGRQLSQKLELEVGRDLQFIRINGTVVGGLVGLVIHIIASLLS